ncbi:hypothetical protein MalM25_28000 [Planctomycetes bacterium MalM25]|nr:hypothetical protein MalM25_28000 [Planctomycetes bacterium MalM25]
MRERFSLGVLLLAIVYASLLFAAFGAYDAPWQVPVFFAALLVLVAVAQLLLRKLSMPRGVSFLAGGVYLGFWAIIWSIQFGAPLWKLVVGILFGAPILLLFGGLLGYVAGVLDSSLFLFHDAIRDSLRAKRVEREALLLANGQKPRESPFDD